jgi:hypothetical protein
MDEFLPTEIWNYVGMYLETRDFAALMQSSRRISVQFPQTQVGFLYKSTLSFLRKFEWKRDFGDWIQCNTSAVRDSDFLYLIMNRQYSQMNRILPNHQKLKSSTLFLALDLLLQYEETAIATAIYDTGRIFYKNS